MYINNQGYSFAGTESGELDGLGKKFWKKKGVMKKVRKNVRKVALVAGTAAALYFAAPLALKAIGSIGAKGAIGAAGAAASAGGGSDYQPEPEYGDTTGYEGQASATVPGAPSLFERAVDSIPFDRIARGTKRPTVIDSAGRVMSQAPSNDLLSFKNVALLGTVGGLGVMLYLLRKGK